MNALGDRCRSVLVLVNKSLYTSPLLHERCGHHVGCVVVSADFGGSDNGIVDCVDIFCKKNTIRHQIVTVSETATEIGDMLNTTATAEEWLTSPLTLIDCTRVVEGESRVGSLLTWLYGDSPPALSREGNRTEVPYTLVAVLDVGRETLCSPPMIASTSLSSDTLAWLRPTPSYYSELMETTGSSTHRYVVYPVQMYSRYPVLRDRGLQEKRAEKGTAAPVPLAEWANKATIDALLRELAFKAGQLAKYGA
ncbi:hypothetical protein JKF63_04000 [Porcisia hertigi]|uniref:Uncharacterized protein n=1 Tax=Porcisia hertigi TaxID=2761500 RepID=A0A836L497_9TRYP|nr:hypothetical protein JKF63_04000 [Porcisia hertigi]